MDKQPAKSARETTIMSVWPSIAVFGAGKLMGRLYGLGPRTSLAGIPLRPGWLLVPATLPIALLLYALKIAPRLPLVVFGASNPWCRRYRLTTSGVVVEHPFDSLSKSRVGRATLQRIGLDEFDSVELEQQPGYAWYRASDVVFRLETREVLRLNAVPHAESFRQTCLKTLQSHRCITNLRSVDQPVSAAV